MVALTLRRKIAFGAGDFGFNLWWQVTSLFLLYYYTDILGLRPEIAGAIYMGALVWDAAVDPVIGMLAERTSTRFGRYRPYLLFGAVPLAALFALLVYNPGKSAATIVAFAAGSHVLFRTAFAIVNIPYSALAARITHDGAVRTELAGMRMMFAVGGAIVVALSTQPLVAALGDGDPARGYGRLGVLLAVVGVGFVWLAAWATRGLDRPSVVGVVETVVPLRRALGASMHNRALLLVSGVTFASVFSQVMFQKNVIYWFRYGLGDAASAGTALAVPGIVCLLLVPVWTLVARRVSKHHVWMIGAAFALAGYAAFFVVAPRGVGPAIAAIALMSIGTAAQIVCFWAMIPDTVEYGEWRTGVRVESFGFGFIVLMQKAALGLGAGSLGLALSAIGYRPNATQTPATLDALLLIMTAVPATGLVVGIVLLSFYPLDRRTYERIVGELKEAP